MRPTERFRKSSSRETKHPYRIWIVAGLGLFVVVLLAIATSGGDSEEDERDSGDAAAKEAEDRRRSASPKPVEPPDSVSPDVPAKPPVPQPVLDREPITVDMAALEEQVGEIWVDKESEKSIARLRQLVDENARGRFDLPARHVDRYEVLVAALEKEKADPFYDEVRKVQAAYDEEFRKSDLHQLNIDDQPYDHPFTVVVDRPYAFFIQSSIDGAYDRIARERAAQLSQLKADFMAWMGRFLDLEGVSTDIIKVTCLRQFPDYKHFNEKRGGLSNAVAHYNPVDRMLVVALDYPQTVTRGDPHYARSVLFHEGTHQLVHGITGRSHLGSYGALWTDEGIPEYFGGHIHTEEKGYEFRKLNPQSVESLAARGTDRKLRLPFIQFLKWTRAAQYGAGGFTSAFITGQVYPMGWALIYFLDNYADGKYRPQLRTILRRQYTDGDTGLYVLRQAFPRDEDFKRLESEFHDYLDELVRAHREKRIWNGEVHDKPR